MKFKKKIKNSKGGGGGGTKRGENENSWPKSNNQSKYSQLKTKTVS